MDAARRGYYHAFGGQPGLSWLLDGFARSLETAGIAEMTRQRMFVTNPARLFAFASTTAG